MSKDSIEAYDVPERIASYDADMDVMHPLRHEMIEVALRLPPFERDASFVALDLGAGTGLFTQRLLERFRNARAIAVDGAASMADVAAERLGGLRERFEFRVGDFQNLDALLAPRESGRLVISSYALHHLDGEAKRVVLDRCVEFLEPGGWFLNADLVAAPTEELAGRYQQLRVEGILERAAPGDARFEDAETTHAFLRTLEATEGDQPLELEQDLEILRASGLRHSAVFWHEFREAVTGGIR
jgi:ubiquinone/menaquinone biosynthesis C-methylase UbiE